MRTTPLIVATAALALALAACGQKSGSTTTITTNSATGTVTTTGDAPPSAASLGLQPGKWETKIEVTELKMSGMTVPKPAPVTTTTCMSPEQASKGPGELLKQAKADCTVNSSTYAGGKIAMEMNSKLPTGTMAMKTTGTYTATSMASDAEVSMTGKTSMTQKVHSEAHRVGECS
jgi:ABC-type Fe3+-hydroxamate transport system substrate-binding protein